MKVSYRSYSIKSLEGDSRQTFSAPLLRELCSDVPVSHLSFAASLVASQHSCPSSCHQASPETKFCQCNIRIARPSFADGYFEGRSLKEHTHIFLPVTVEATTYFLVAAFSWLAKPVEFIFILEFLWCFFGKEWNWALVVGVHAVSMKLGRWGRRSTVDVRCAK